MIWFSKKHASMVLIFFLIILAQNAVYIKSASSRLSFGTVHKLKFFNAMQDQTQNKLTLK